MGGALSVPPEPTLAVRGPLVALVADAQPREGDQLVTSALANQEAAAERSWLLRPTEEPASSTPEPMPAAPQEANPLQAAAPVFALPAVASSPGDAGGQGHPAHIAAADIGLFPAVEQPKGEESSEEEWF